MNAEATFNHEIDYNPKPEDGGTVKIYASIAFDLNHTLTCPTSPVSSIVYEFERDGRSGGNQVLKAFLMDAGINTDVLIDLDLYVHEIVIFSHGYCRIGSALSVWMRIDPIQEEEEEEEEEEAVQVSFGETYIVSRPVSKLAVMSLNKGIYKKNKTSSMQCDSCSICLEEFGTGNKVVTLPCGHLFDDDCIVHWFRTSHVCPLCRFKLPT